MDMTRLFFVAVALVVTLAPGCSRRPVAQAGKSPPAYVSSSPRTTAAPAFEDEPYFPYANSGWSEFFAALGKAVVEQQDLSRRVIDCSELELPLHEGRVDNDRVGYDLRVDDRVLKFWTMDGQVGPRMGWIAYEDHSCRDALQPSIEAWVESRLAWYERTGESAADLPGGP